MVKRSKISGDDNRQESDFKAAFRAEQAKQDERTDGMSRCETLIDLLFNIFYKSKQSMDHFFLGALRS